jgi:integrase
MSPELEAIVEFLMGSRVAPSLVPWRLLRKDDLRVIRAWAAETRTQASQGRLLASLRQMLSEATASSDSEPAEFRAESVSLRRPSRRRVLRRGLTARESRLLLEVCDDTTIEGRRDGAIIALMLLAGLRRQEIAGLQRSDYDDADACLRVKSPGGPTRIIGLEGRCREALEAWLDTGGGVSGPMFVTIHGGEMQPRGITLSAVNRLLAKRCRQAGCSRVTPRDLRSCFLWQLQSGSRLDQRPPCRYQQTEDGEVAWALPCLAGV